MSTSKLQPQASSQQPVHGRSPRTPQPHQTAVGISIALRALEGEGEAEYVALGALCLDERNVRKDPPTDEEIEELADLIDAQGLLQNLTVVAYELPIRSLGRGKGRAKRAARSFTHGVIAGGRRWRALMRLVDRERITLEEPILCTKVAAERAVAVSAAENSGRKAMSTADTLMAFADMVRAGAGVEELAVCFGLSPLTVQRRFKLANVSPKLFDLFRQDAMTLDQLMALALSDEHETQEAAWKAAPAHNRSPRALRALIAGESLSRNIIKFVGLKAYLAAGGTVLQDLFAVDDEQAEYIQDPALMMRLAVEKLDAIGKKAKDQGAPWTQSFTSFGYSEREQFVDAPSHLRAATEEEAQALLTIEAEQAQVEAELEAINEWGDGEGEVGEVSGVADPAQVDKLEERSRELARQHLLLKEARREVVPEVAGMVGTVVFIDDKGKVCKLSKVRKEDLAAARRATSKACRANLEREDAGGSNASPAGSHLSDRLCRQLTAHRTRALHALLLDQPKVALAALLHPMLASLIYGPSGLYESPSSIGVRVESVEGALHRWAPDLEGGRAENLVQVAVGKARQQLPLHPKDLLHCLLRLEIPALVDLLTLVAALTLDAISGTADPDSSDELAVALGLEMSAWWAPTAPAYLAHIPKNLIAAAVAESGMADEAQALSKMKKSEAVAAAESLLQGKAWVPSILRR